MKKPNFAIVGAPKCGTTSLHRYLHDHPNVFLTRVKEPHYFASDFSDYRRFHTLTEYERLFDGCGPEHLAIGESSVFYLYSKLAIDNLVKYNPDIKLIVMLRNPVDMLYSLHSQLLYGFRESVKDFRQAWNLQAERAKGRKLPTNCLAPEHLQYGQVGRLGEQVQRLLERVPRERVHLILLEDMIASPRAVYEQALQFLGLESDNRSEFPRINDNKVHRSRMLSRLWMRPPFPLNHLKNSIKNTLSLQEPRLSRFVLGLGSRSSSRRGLPADFRSELVEYFREDVERLAIILARDLSHWSQMPPAALNSPADYMESTGDKTFPHAHRDRS